MVVENRYYKLSRVFVDLELREGECISVDADLLHYLKVVMRKQDGDEVRVFNGVDGEWLCRLQFSGRSECRLGVVKKIREQPEVKRRVCLLFSPIRRKRMDFLVEKAVELGVTDFYPVITSNTQFGKVNHERMKKNVIEACEQCERLDVPVINSVDGLCNILDKWDHGVDIVACIERSGSVHISVYIGELAGCGCTSFGGDSEKGGVALLVGPEGGFTEEEKELLCSLDFVKPVSLGNRILKSETAVCYGLAVLSLGA